MMNNGILLNGLRGALKNSVLAHVDDPAAKRQLKAALHLIGRLSKIWDLAPNILRADIADIGQVLNDLERDLKEKGHEFSPELPDIPAQAAGYNDPHLMQMAQEYEQLCFKLEALEAFARTHLPLPLAKHCLCELQILYARMTRRELIGNGDIPFPTDDDLMSIKA